MRGYRLESVGVSRLRGFRDSTLHVPDRVMFLVGPNNSGKTSVLRIIDWALIRARRATLFSEEALSPEETALLVPASPSAGRGRRITLKVKVDHRGSQGRYGCDRTGLATIRIGVTSAGIARINLGAPRRGESETEGLAWELLERLRERTVFTLIPAARDARSPSFAQAFRDAADARIAKRALHARQARPYVESQNTKTALEAINKMAQELLAPLWDDIGAMIPDGLAKGGTIMPEVDPEGLVDWLADHTVMKMVTGSHDAYGVRPDQVGAGLQSLLELAINRAGGAERDVDWIIGLEEPEAFLHPSAQRSLARSIETKSARLVVSTHSPTVIDEAPFGQVTLVRDHRFYPPRDQEDATRQSINTALMTGAGAEMLFARSVLLVEGPGDQHFFEGLRRRMAREAGISGADLLWVVSVGGKDFTAWIQLLRSYGDEGDRPISWRVVADDDAIEEVLTAFQSAGQALDSGLRVTLGKLNEAFKTVKRADAWLDEIDAANALAAGDGRAPFFLPGELENAMLSHASPGTARRVAKLTGGVCPSDLQALISYLGRDKQKWLRASVAQALPWCEMSPSIQAILRAWLAPVLGDADATSAVSDLCN